MSIHSLRINTRAFSPVLAAFDTPIEFLKATKEVELRAGMKVYNRLEVRLELQALFRLQHVTG